MTHDDDPMGDRRFAKRAADLLARSAREIGDDERAALDRARRSALDAISSQPSTPWVPLATAAGAATVAAVLAWTALRGPDPMPVAAADESDADMDIVLAAEDFEMLEDLEFFAWLTDNRDAG